MGRIRKHLTYANVMATIAVFLVLGGGTAVAAFVVSSNSQVGPNTIYGHRAPAAANKNIVAGSIGGQDVADESLGGVDIVEGSLLGRVRKLIYTATASAAGPLASLVKTDSYTIKAQCKARPSDYLFALYARGPAGAADWMATESFNDTTNFNPVSSDRVPIPAGQDTLILRSVGDAGQFTRIAGTAMLRSGSGLVQVEFNAGTDGHPGQRCFLYGTVIRALE
jgi:hypothetical protein